MRGAMIRRRRWIFAAGIAAAALLTTALPGDEAQSNPWSKAELMEPASLVKVLKSSGAQPTIICVTFPFLYRQRHVLHAKYAGPGNKPEGLAALREAVQGMPKDSEIVIYCGCCPMLKCPNIRPAYELLKQLGFNHVRVLDIPTNFHTDWASKGYPVE
jgi:thiosulfate/3-mercaptopyruvate sulfurtransferase